MATEPYWSWCAAPGVSRATKLAVDIVSYGDGYVHRLTRGLNPARPSWSLTFPFVGIEVADAMDAFLKANATAGFYFTPPDSSVEVFVTCDEWSVTSDDKNKQRGIIGMLSATFERSFNPQPIS